MKSLQESLNELLLEAGENKLIDLLYRYKNEIGKSVPGTMTYGHIAVKEWWALWDLKTDSAFRKSIPGLTKMTKNDVKKSQDKPILGFFRRIGDPKFKRGYEAIVGIRLPDSIVKGGLTICFRRRFGFLWKDTTPDEKNEGSYISKGPGEMWFTNLNEVTAYELPEKFAQEIAQTLDL